jgi:hypothetical protein
MKEAQSVSQLTAGPGLGLVLCFSHGAKGATNTQESMQNRGRLSDNLDISESGTNRRLEFNFLQI